MAAYQILLWTWSTSRKLWQKITPGVSRTSRTSSGSFGPDNRLSEVLWSLALKSVLCCDTLSKDEAKSRARKANTALLFAEEPKTCPKCLKIRLGCVVELYERESTEAPGYETWTPFPSQPHPSANKSLCLRTKPTFSLCFQRWRPGPLSMGIAQSLSHGWLIFFLPLEYISGPLPAVDSLVSNTGACVLSVPSELMGLSSRPCCFSQTSLAPRTLPPLWRWLKMINGFRSCWEEDREEEGREDLETDRNNPTSLRKRLWVYLAAAVWSRQHGHAANHRKSARKMTHIHSWHGTRIQTSGLLFCSNVLDVDCPPDSGPDPAGRLAGLSRKHRQISTLLWAYLNRDCKPWEALSTVLAQDTPREQILFLFCAHCPIPRREKQENGIRWSATGRGTLLRELMWAELFSPLTLLLLREENKLAVAWCHTH